MALLLLHNNLKEKLVSFIRKEGEGDLDTADPYIVWKWTCFIEGEYDVYAERILIAKTKCLVKAYLILLSSIYVFNSALPKSMCSTLTFLHKVILGHTDNSKKDNKVINLLAKINRLLNN